MKHYNIPIFVPHRGCPFDCVFCNQKHITGAGEEVTPETVKETIARYLKTLPQDGVIEAAFFGGSFTGIDFAEQRRLLAAAYPYVQTGKIQGIRLSTRPDYMDERICDQLTEFSVTTVELGVQSMDREVLLAARRGHTAEDVKKAVALLRQYPFQVGLQMMTGLPGDSPEKSVNTAKALIALKPDFVRIYPTLVVRDTYLEKMYQNGQYRPETLQEAVELCKTLLVMFSEAEIPVIRVALQTTDEIAPGGAMVAGPFHSAFRELCEGEIFLDKMMELLVINGPGIVLAHPKELSKAIGNRKRNLDRLRAQFGAGVQIIGDESVPLGAVCWRKKEG